jgi:hypothetical protein
MLNSALAFILSAFFILTFLTLATFLIRIALTFLLARFSAIVSGNKSPVTIVKNALQIAHPVGFLTSILHGFWAIAVAISVFGWFDLEKDLFIGLLVVSTFIVRDIRKLNKKPIKKAKKTTPKEGTLTILEDPYEESISANDFQQNPFGNFNTGNNAGGNYIQDYFKDQYQEFIHGNSLVGMIGRITGAALGTLTYIGL